MTSGASELALSFVPLAVFAALGAATDLLRGKIYNWLTVSMFVSGIALGAFVGGWAGIAQAALGAGAGLLIYGWLFALRAMGGGDVKFLMGFGAWGGPRFALEVGIMGILIGGALAVVVLVARGRFLAFLRKAYRFFLTALQPELEVEFPKADPSLTLPFGVPIAIAALWATLGHPLESLGLALWH